MYWVLQELFQTRSLTCREANTAKLALFQGHFMNAPVNNSLVRGRKISDDPGLNASPSNGTAETVETVNEFGGDVPFDSEINHLLETSNFNMALQEERT
ncbi:MAG TPA: hypothetical protein VFA15_06595, partial [Nitrososphaera sp.]|nr:hypothetical protein [Nitrososphaera sp.]